MIKKGQVSIEYLVILAVVLVVALIVVYLVGGFSGLGSGSLATQSQNYWGSASPFAVKTVKYSGTVLNLELVNNGLDQLTVTGITVNGSSVFSTATVFNSGQDVVLVAAANSNCGTAGTPYNLPSPVIVYTKGGVAGLQEVGAKPFVGSCS